MKCTLIVESGPGNATSFDFDKEETTIGRIMGNDLVINDMSVSRYHAKIVRSEGAFELIDLDSKNGIKHNGEKKKSALLTDGDSIEIGTVPLKFRCPELSPEPDAGKTVITQVPESKDKSTDSIVKDAADRLAELFNKKKEKDTLPQEKAADAEGFRTDRLSHPLILAVLGIMLVLVVVLSLRENDKTIKDRSDIPVPLPAKGSYGNMEHSRSYADKVVFTFSWTRGNVYLSYNIGLTDADEVEISLNGHKLGNAPPSASWLRIEKIPLPPAYMKAGENRLVFDNVLTPPGSRAEEAKAETWGVSDIEVQIFN